jgi:hypothetical protein
MAGHGMARRWVPPLVIVLLLIGGVFVMFQRVENDTPSRIPSVKTAPTDPCSISSLATSLSHVPTEDAHDLDKIEPPLVTEAIDKDGTVIASQESAASKATKEAATTVERAAASQTSVSEMVRGVLVDIEGNPVEGYVTLEYAAIDPNGLPSSSFAIPIPAIQPTGGLVGLARDVSGTMGRYFLWPEGDPNKELVLVLEPCGSIIGHVVGSDRKPVPGVQLDLETRTRNGQWRGGGPWLDPPVIDEDGYFVFDCIPPGWRMKVTAHRGLLSGQSRAVTLTSGETADAGEIRMIGRRPGDGTIQGRIVDERRRPLTNRAIRVRLGRSSQWLRTDAAGYFALTDLPRAAAVTVTVEVDGYGSWSRIATPDDFACDFRVCPQGYDVVGKTALPVFAETWFNHEPTTLERLRGQVVVLAFRGFDRDVDPGLSRILDLQNEYGADGLQIVAIYNCLPTTSAMAEDIIAGHLTALFEGASIAGVLDADTTAVADLMPAERPAGAAAGATHWMYQVHQRPAFYLIDKEGIVRYCTGDDTELRDWIERLLDE